MKYVCKVYKTPKSDIAIGIRVITKDEETPKLIQELLKSNCPFIVCPDMDVATIDILSTLWDEESVKDVLK